MFKYSTGEIQVNLGEINIGMPFHLSLLKADADSIMELLLSVNAIKEAGGRLGTLHIKFFPYARQDRVCSTGQAFSLKVMAKLINDLGFQEVVVTEPHSSVLNALVDNLKVIKLADRLRDLPYNKIIIAPDAGAEKRAFEVAQKYNCFLVTASKRRNLKTGAIDKIEVFCDDLKGHDCLIIDDICDGGRTFIELAKVLKDKNAGRITLVVAHGIFSNGMNVFKHIIDEIYYLEDNNNLTKKEF